MKFCCINNEGWESLIKKTESLGPQMGDIVTKVGEQAFGGQLYFIFSEWPEGDNSYRGDCFIPINESAEKAEMKEVEFTKIKKEVPISAN